MNSISMFKLFIVTVLSYYTSSDSVRIDYKFFTNVKSKISTVLVSSALSLNILILPSNAGMMTFPLPAEMKNNIAFMRFLINT